jgi:hypothetical protein
MMTMLCRRLLHGAGHSKPASAAVADREYDEAMVGSIPLSQRLAALDAAPADSGVVDAAANNGIDALPEHGTGDHLTADSLVILLTQALRAQDKVRLLARCFAAVCFAQSMYGPCPLETCACSQMTHTAAIHPLAVQSVFCSCNLSVQVLLEKVLSIGNKTVIAKTMQRLPPVEAASFLRAAVDRIQSRPARAAMLLPWLHATLLHHSTYLAAVPSVKEHLATMHRIVQGRVAILPGLLEMRGRLDFVLAHARTAQDDVDNPLHAPMVCLHHGSRHVSHHYHPPLQLFRHVPLWLQVEG